MRMAGERSSLSPCLNAPVTARGKAPPEECDLAIVGAGIIGLAVARELTARRPAMSVTVLEKEEEVGFHQTGHNSGVVHAGIYYVPGSLKAKLCVEGAHELYRYCEEHGVQHEPCGKVIVALHERELDALDELERRGRANGVPDLCRLSASELREVEPHATVVAALHSPFTGIVDFPGVARAIAAEIESREVDLATGCGVAGVEVARRRVELRHSKGATRAR